MRVKPIQNEISSSSSSSHTQTETDPPALQHETLISVLKRRRKKNYEGKRERRSERKCVCERGDGVGWLRGEEGKLEQLAALSRTHQGEIERGRKREKKRGGRERREREAVAEDEEEGKERTKGWTTEGATKRGYGSLRLLSIRSPVFRPPHLPRLGLNPVERHIATQLLRRCLGATHDSLQQAHWTRMSPTAHTHTRTNQHKDSH